MTVTVCIEDEQGKEQTHEVSDEFMELCFERAKAISLEVLDLAREMNAQQWYATIREKAGENANEVQQTIIVDMVKNLLQTGMKYSMLRMLLDVLTK
mgnify:FL=1